MPKSRAINGVPRFIGESIRFKIMPVAVIIVKLRLTGAWWVALILI